MFDTLKDTNINAFF